MVINSDTIEAGRHASVPINLWQTARNSNIIILAAEQLKTKSFGQLLQDAAFCPRIISLAVDEVHLLGSWGNELRPMFQQIGNIRLRMPPLALMGLTATLRTGAPTAAVCRILGLHNFHLIRRSNMRHDIRIIMRRMQSGVRSLRFPELDWVLDSGRRIIIFCTTISFGFRVTAYLWYMSTSLPNKHERIRMYNSLNPPSYNARTLELMHNDPRSRVTVATDTLMVGIDAANTDDVILIGDVPRTPDDIVQKGGRIRDGKDRDSRLIIYLPQNAEENAAAALGLPSTKKSAKAASAGKKAASPPAMDPSVARFILAPCKVDLLDELYENRAESTPCACVVCSLHPPIQRPVPCTCSGCKPDPPPQIPAPPPRTTVPKARPRSSRKKPLKLTIPMKDRGTERLLQFREWLWGQAEDDLSYSLMPMYQFFPDDLIKYFLEFFTSIHSVDDIPLAVVDHSLVVPYCDSLYTIFLELRSEFDEMRRKALEKKKAGMTTAQQKTQREKLLRGHAFKSRSKSGKSRKTDRSSLNKSRIPIQSPARTPFTIRLPARLQASTVSSSAPQPPPPVASSLLSMIQQNNTASSSTSTSTGLTIRIPGRVRRDANGTASRMS